MSPTIDNFPADSIHRILNELRDPFNLVYPLHSVARKLDEDNRESSLEIGERSGPYGVALKFHDIQQEHEGKETLVRLGASFVLSQTFITQVVSRCSKIARLAGSPSWLPPSKREMMNLESDFVKHAGVSRILLIDAVANYYKHHEEWPENWDTMQVGVPGRETSRLVCLMSFTPRSEHNLHRALEYLEQKGAGDLVSTVESWQERLMK